MFLKAGRIIGLLALSSAFCFSDVIVADNAGPLLSSAQDLTGGDSLSGIVGALTTSSDGSPYPDFESVFKIDILNFRAFFAEVVPVGPHGLTDTDLFLFDAQGNGVYMNDDISGGNTLSCLPSLGASNPCPSSRNGVGPTSDGIYYLAISTSANYPVSATGEIFSPSSSTDVVGPDYTQGGGSPFTGWDDGAFTNPNTDQVDYDIVLCGTTPEPATYLLIAGPLCALALLRKKRISVKDR